MRHLALALCVLAGLAGACSDSGGGDADVDSLKQQAKRSYEADLAGNPDAPAASSSDPCTTHKWYGDGACDSWCPGGDRDDCTMSDDGGVACAEFWSPADGKCDWSDPCGPTQDEDCQQRDGGGGVVCTLIYRLPDGKCDLSDPCAKLQDADCQGGGTDPVACPAIAYEQNGKCEAPAGCEQNDPDCGVICLAVVYETNGKCEAARGCESSDPVDCAIACIEIAYPQNGKCEAARGCEYTDPVDCKAPVACDAIGYLQDGVCSAPRGCEANDPDCK